MKRQLPRIADSEWRVMQVLWERGPQTANDVVGAGILIWAARALGLL